MSRKYRSVREYFYNVTNRQLTGYIDSMKRNGYPYYSAIGADLADTLIEIRELPETNGSKKFGECF